MKYIFYLQVLGLVIFCILGTNVAYAESPSIFFSAISKQVQEGEKLNVDVRIQSSMQSINAISGTISFPENLVSVSSISKDKSIVNLWIREPKVARGQISFEGVVLNPGFQGENGLIFRIIFEAKQTGNVFLSLTEGSILANDGLGTNVLGALKSLSFTIKAVSQVSRPLALENISAAPIIIPPVIISEIPPLRPSESFILKGRGAPNALTKIQFQDVTEPSIGVKFIRSFIKNRVPLKAVELKNDNNGIFSYVSPANLVAGVYNAVPEYVSNDKTESIIGTGIKLFIQENTISKILIIIINALVLIIPILALILLIIFLPWYFIRRLRVMRKQMEFEEEKIDVEERNLINGPK